MFCTARYYVLAINHYGQIEKMSLFNVIEGGLHQGQLELVVET